MKGVLGLTTFAMMLTVAPADAVDFVGRFKVIAVPGCAEQELGAEGNVRYRLSGLPGNGPQTALGLFFDANARNFRKTGRFSSAGFTSAATNVTGAAIYDKPIAEFPAKLRVTTSVPADSEITATTPFVSIIAQIRNPEDPNADACTITIRASLILR